jgi:hypothetical protein
VHGQVDFPGEERFLDFLGEQPLAADLGERPVADAVSMSSSARPWAAIRRLRVSLAW